MVFHWSALYLRRRCAALAPPNATPDDIKRPWKISLLSVSNILMEEKGTEWIKGTLECMQALEGADIETENAQARLPGWLLGLWRCFSLRASFADVSSFCSPVFKTASSTSFLLVQTQPKNTLQWRPRSQGSAPSASAAGPNSTNKAGGERPHRDIE